MWLVFALLTVVVWGIADLFYKKGAEEKDKYSYLKTSMIVGFVMGVHAIYMLVFGNLNYDYTNIILYLPVSFMYILSMTIGYLGLRYLEVSISSPIQNASSAIVCLLCFIFLHETLEIPSIIAIILICLGIFLLGLFEKRKQNIENKKYRIGFVAFFLPIIYCLLDALGTFFDAYYLEDASTTILRNVTESTLENVANTSYEITFLICAILIFIYLKFIKKEKIFIKKETSKISAAIFETVGQFTYVHAMSGMAIVAAPVVSSYCIVSIILSRIILKEKLFKKQYFSIALVLIGIIILAVLENLN